MDFVASGVVVRYDEALGFGFLRVRGEREDLFVHVRDVEGGGPLRAGQRVRFRGVEADAHGPRAVGVVPGRRGLPPTGTSAIGLAVALGVVAFGFREVGLPWVVAGLLAVNLLTVLVYARDKQQARKGARRLPEWVLLAMAFLGGWPAALLAMALLRHKTRKRSFRLAFFGVVALELAMVGGVCWRWGSLWG